MSTFPYKGWGAFLTLFLEISLWVLACRPALGSIFLIKNQSGGKIIFPAFFRHFFKNFVLGPWRGVSKIINIGSGNSILDLIMHFRLSLYHSTPLFPHFPPPQGQRSLLTLFLKIVLWISAYRPELWSSFWIKHQSGGNNNFFSYFSDIFSKTLW